MPGIPSASGALPVGRERATGWFLAYVCAFLAYERARTQGKPVNIPIPTADTDAEETPRQASARAAADRAAKAAQRAADWRARRAEEEADLKRRAALDASIVNALLVELAELDDANRRAGIEGPAKIGMREVMASVIRRGEPVIPRQEMARQLHARLAPGRPNPYAAA